MYHEGRFFCLRRTKSGFYRLRQTTLRQCVQAMALPFSDRRMKGLRKKGKENMRGASESRLLRYCVLVFLAALLAGCATTSETSTLQENLSILNQRQAALEKRVQSFEGVSRRSGDLYAQIQELQAQMRTLNGRIEQVEHKVDQMEQSQAPAANVPPSATPPSGTVVIQGMPPSSQPSGPQHGAAPPSPGVEAYPRTGAPAHLAAVPGKNAEELEFDRGVRLLKQKKYGAARKVFKEFVSRFPKSGLDESAMYYIGECYFGERHYEDAIKAFQAVVDKYPKGGKTASALLKEGIGWQEIGEATMARIIYTRLVANYPGTAQARAAEKKLKQM